MLEVAEGAGDAASSKVPHSSSSTSLSLAVVIGAGTAAAGALSNDPQPKSTGFAA